MTEISDSLADAISGAVDDWLAAHGGGMITGYAMVMNYYDVEGEACWATTHAEKQAAATTLGLLRWHTMAVEHDVKTYLNGEGE